MIQYRIMRRITFSAGHRLLGHEGGCAHFHGHNYVAEIYCEPDIVNRLPERVGLPAIGSREENMPLDEVGRVVDFSEVKELVGGWINAQWDHAFIIYDGDFEAKAALDRIAGQKLYEANFNPTAENMAAFLLTQICPRVLKHSGVIASRVVIWETENAKAEAALR